MPDAFFCQVDESETSIYDFLREEVAAEAAGKADSEDAAENSDSSVLTPYTSNSAYLSDCIDWLSTRIRHVRISVLEQRKPHAYHSSSAQSCA